MDLETRTKMITEEEIAKIIDEAIDEVPITQRIIRPGHIWERISVGERHLATVERMKKRCKQKGREFGIIAEKDEIINQIFLSPQYNPSDISRKIWPKDDPSQHYDRISKIYNSLKREGIKIPEAVRSKQKGTVAEKIREAILAGNYSICKISKEVYGNEDWRKHRSYILRIYKLMEKEGPNENKLPHRKSLKDQIIEAYLRGESAEQIAKQLYSPEQLKNGKDYVRRVLSKMNEDAEDANKKEAIKDMFISVANEIPNEDFNAARDATNNLKPAEPTPKATGSAKKTVDGSESELT